MSKDKFFILGCVLGSAVLVLFGPAGVAQADMPTEGLVSYWTFDEGEGDTAYDSAGGNDGTLINSPNWITGKIGGALEFDGGDEYVSLSSNAVTSTEFTVSGWANQYGPSGGELSANTIFAQRDDSVGSNHSLIGLHTDSAGGYSAAEIRSSIGSYQKLVYPKKNYHEWHHYAMTVSATDFVFYIDGTEVNRASNNQQGDYVTSIDHIYFGKVEYGQGTARSYFNGLIDEVAMWDRALLAEEVEQLYLAGLDLLTDLEIVGPPQVAENFNTTYMAIAHYESGRTEDVTASTEWAVNDDQTATIDENGLLQTAAVSLPRDVTIYAEYTEHDITVAAEKVISVLPMCLEGSALDFDGADDYVEIGPGVLPVGDKSFFAWIKMPPVGQSPDAQHDYFIYVASINLEAIFFYFDNGVSLRCLRSGSGGFDAHYTVALDDDQWHHVGFIYDNETSTLRLYFDGTEVATSTGNDLSESSVWEFFGSFQGDVVERSWKGKIDEVSIFNRVLGSVEVLEQMYAKPTGGEPGLVAYWSFDEGEGQIAHDLAGGHDGYLGSDGENPDDSDPAWVESDAPAGICPPQALLERNISNALEIKQNILQQLAEALASERAAEDILRDMQRNRDITELSPIQVIRARIKIVWAIVKEVWSQRKITQSKEHLEDSLEIVTQEPDLNPAGRQRRTRRSRR